MIQLKSASVRDLVRRLVGMGGESIQDVESAVKLVMEVGRRDFAFDLLFENGVLAWHADCFQNAVVGQNGYFAVNNANVEDRRLVIITEARLDENNAFNWRAYEEASATGLGGTNQTITARDNRWRGSQAPEVAGWAPVVVLGGTIAGAPPGALLVWQSPQTVAPFTNWDGGPKVLRPTDQYVFWVNAVNTAMNASIRGFLLPFDTR